MKITVAQMVEALSRLPQDAELVVTDAAYASGEFAEIMLPEEYTPEGFRLYDPVMYRIGHAHQTY